MKTAFTRQLKGLLNIREIVLYQIGLAILLLTLGLTSYVFSHTYERFSPSESWFEYAATPTIPLKLQYATGETIKYHSDIEYHKTIDMRWEDTMWCSQSDGLKKYPTQFWPADRGSQRKLAGNTNLSAAKDGELSFWDYYIVLPDKDATSCYLRSVAIGTTPLGYEKTVAFFTDAVLVNINK